MSCPTCNHTMQTLNVSTISEFYWCPRCGTIKSIVTAFMKKDDVTLVPKLPERCRQFEKELKEEIRVYNCPQFPLELWRQLGVQESINVAT